MTDSNVVRENIHSLLNVASDAFTDVEFFQRLNLESCADQADVYLYRRSSLLSSLSEVLVLPKRAATSPAGVFECVRSAWEPARSFPVVFIDCFEQRGNAEPRDLSIMTPAQLWSRLSGTSMYTAIMEGDSELQGIESRYLHRELCHLQCNSAGQLALHSPRDAISFLSQWADLPPLEAMNILIYGERGSGKSWLLKRFAKAQYERHKGRVWEIAPAIYVNLRDYAGYLFNSQGIERSLAYYLYAKNGVRSVGDVFFWESLIKSGQVILLLDSFDEMSKEVFGEGMEEEFRTLAEYLPIRSKAVITTRGTRFRSLSDLYEVFSGYTLAESGKRARLPSYVPSLRSERYFPRHDLFTITSFDEEDVRELASSFRELESDAGAFDERVRSLLSEASPDKFLTTQCLELATIPAAAEALLRAVASSPQKPLRVYEATLLNPLISHNLETGRAIVEYRYREFPGGPIQEGLVDLRTRIEIIELIAWHLAETERSIFDADDIANTSADIDSARFSAIVTDLRSQTIFDFDEQSPSLKFRLDTIQAYFTARYIFSRLCDPRRLTIGIKCLGSRKLTGSTLGETIGEFLHRFVVHGFLDFSPGEISRLDPGDPEESGEVRHVCQEDLAGVITSLLVKQPVYSFWTRYLSENLKRMKCSVPEIRRVNVWESNPLPRDHTDLSPLEDDTGILVSGDVEESLEALYVSIREERNRHFLAFLEDDLTPMLVPVGKEQRDRLPNCKVATKVVFRESTDPKQHPLSWQAIHRPDEPCERSFLAFTNDYHLFNWHDKGRFPEGLDDHPVIWLSAYVIAIYCNWKSLKSGLSEEDLYYEVYVDDQGTAKVVKNKGRQGFRLLTEREWRFCARGGDEGTNPWSTKLHSRNPEERRRGDLLREFLTDPLRGPTSVLLSLSNEFGIYGMIGNVREWVDLDAEDATKAKQNGRIMGATGTLGVHTFEYNFEGVPLPKENTNLDVGFRWARSVPLEVLNTIHRAQQGNAGLAADRIQPKEKDDGGAIPT